MEEPRRAKLLSDSALPTFVTSMTDRENKEPSRAIPNTATVDPTRAMPRSDSEDPNWKKSKTDTDAPSRATPSTEIAAPRRAILLKASDEPSLE
jgi:hypothetical protein